MWMTHGHESEVEYAASSARSGFLFRLALLSRPAALLRIGDALSCIRAENACLAHLGSGFFRTTLGRFGTARTCSRQQSPGFSQSTNLSINFRKNSFNSHAIRI